MVTKNNIILQVWREENNLQDPYAVAVKHNGITIGHMPREYSRFLSNFMEHKGELVKQVISVRKPRSPISHGGLEILILVKPIHDDKYTAESFCQFSNLAANLLADGPMIQG